MAIDQSTVSGDVTIQGALEALGGINSLSNIENITKTSESIGAVAAVQASTNDLMDYVADIADDEKVTPEEKKILQREWLAIAAEYITICADAAAAGIDPSDPTFDDYIDAYVLLDDYLNGASGILDNMATTSTITRSALTGYFSSFVDTRASILNAIVNTLMIATMVLYINPSVPVMKKSITDAFTPSSVMFYFYYVLGVDPPAPYAGYWKLYETTNGTDWTLKESASANATSRSRTPSAANVVGIKCELYVAGGFDTLLDSQSVVIVSEGATGATGPGGIAGILSNEAHVFPASVAGAVSSYTGSGTQIRVYEGVTELAYDGTGTSNGTWKVESSATNITRGAITDSGNYATVADHSGVADGTDTASIVYTITGKSAAGVAFTLTKTQTFSKSKIGATGSTGPAGVITAADHTAVSPTYEGLLVYENTTGLWWRYTSSAWKQETGTLPDSTAIAAYWPLGESPDVPDDPSGTVSVTVTGLAGCTVTNEGTYWRVVAATADPSVSIGGVGLIPAGSIRVRYKIKLITGTPSDEGYDFFTDASYRGSTRVVAGSDWTQYDAYLTPDAGKQFNFIRVDALGSTGEVWIKDVYVGSGLYLTPAIDASGLGGHGTVHGCLPIAGKYGKALDFNGSTDYTETSNIRHPAALTYAAWVRVDAWPTTYGFICTRNSENWWFAIYTSGGVHYLMVGYRNAAGSGLSYEITIDGKVGLGEFHRLVGTHDGTNVQLYVDSVLIGTSNATTMQAEGSQSSAAYMIGSFDGTQYFLNCAIQHVRIDSRAWSDAEVRGDWEAGGVYPKQFLLSDYKFDDLPTYTPKYLGAKTADPTSGMVIGDYFLHSDATPKAFRRWSGTAWSNVATSDALFSAYCGIAMQDLIALELDATDQSTGGFTFITNLVAKNLFAKVITLLSGGEVKSSNYSAGSAGFRMRGDIGWAEFRDILISGEFFGDVRSNDISPSGSSHSGEIGSATSYFSKIFVDYIKTYKIEQEDTYGHLKPIDNGSIDLGSSSKYWRNIYSNNAYTPTIYTDRIYEDGTSDAPTGPTGSKGMWAVKYANLTVGARFWSPHYAAWYALNYSSGW